MASLFGGGGGATPSGTGVMGSEEMQGAPVGGGGGGMDMKKLGKGLKDFGSMTGMQADPGQRMMAPIGWLGAQQTGQYQQQMPSVTNPGMPVQSMAEIVGRTAKSGRAARRDLP